MRPCDLDTARSHGAPLLAFVAHGRVVGKENVFFYKLVSATVQFVSACERQAPLSCGKGTAEADTKAFGARWGWNSCLSVVKEWLKHARGFHSVHVAGSRCSSDAICKYDVNMICFDDL